MARHLHIASFFAISTITTLSCGQGAPNIPNDPIPVGTVVASGPFTSLAGKTASGIASVYLVSPNSYVVHLHQVTFPNEPALQMVAEVNGSRLAPVVLPSNQGSMNFSITLTGTPTWNAIYIHSTQNVITPDYAVAILQAQ